MANMRSLAQKRVAGFSGNSLGPPGMRDYSSIPEFSYTKKKRKPHVPPFHQDAGDRLAAFLGHGRTFS